ncbi:MAG TPA: hypothetical protein PKY82_14830 [Pyrinomonadaceae bacterium]|nr:hypothetical protein [Pyrinomonadaceae bacterium]
MKSLIFIFLLGYSMTFAQDKKEFKLFLLPSKIKSEQLSNLDLKKIKPFGDPFLTSGDIWTYLKDTHEIIINFTAAERLKKLSVTENGRPFVVFVGNEPIYVGAFWKGFTSTTFRGVAVDVSNLQGDFPKIILELDYPPLAPKNIAFDPRPDPRIFEVFQKAGILYEQVWMWGKCKKIRASGKRRQSFYFTFDISSVVKSNFERTEIEFELADTEGFRLIDAIRAEPKSKSYVETEWNFDSEKEILLKFERLISGKTPVIYLRTFEVY